MTYVLLTIAVIEFLLLIYLYKEKTVWIERFKSLNEKIDDMDGHIKDRINRPDNDDPRIRDDYYFGRSFGGEYWIYKDPISGKVYRSENPRDPDWEKQVELTD